MSDPYQIGTEHTIGSHRYLVMPQSDDETVWLQLWGTTIETPVSRGMLTDRLINSGPILDRQIAAYYAGTWAAVPVSARDSLL